MKYKWLFILLIVSVLAQQCAKQTAPTGGPKDEIPPTLVRSNPAHKEVNFKGKEIQLTFDEPIQLNNPREQLIITPSIGKKFEVTGRKNKVVLTFNSKLQDNTTYSINFRESVQDLTEKNPAKIKLAFSTGTYIDSLSVTGTVTDILTDNRVKNYTVALVPASDTFNIFKHTAFWTTLTDKQGKYALENLKPGKYFLYAFDDKNKNLVVDSKSEKYGFKSDNINLTETNDSIKLSVFKLDASNLKLISSRPTFAYYTIRLSKSIVDYKLTPSANTQKIYEKLESDLTTIKVYNTIPDLDSLQVRFEARDSMDSRVDTLLYVKFPKKESTKDKFSGNIESVNFYEGKSLLSAALSFSKPVINFNSDSLYVQVDSLTRITFTKDNFTWNEFLTKLTISKKLEPQAKETAAAAVDPGRKTDKKSQKNDSQFILAKGSIISVENDTATRMVRPLKTIKPEDYGIVFTKIETKEDFTLQLLDKSNKVIEETRNNKNHPLENLPPGTYLMRVLIDLNKNGKWDAGDYKKKSQPEPILYYHNPKGSKDIFLKANWQIGPLLISY